MRGIKQTRMAKEIKRTIELEGCGKMYCAVEGCNQVDVLHSAYCSEHRRSTHFICGENKLCPTCRAKNRLIKGCKQKFVYQHEEEGVLVLRCGEWNNVGGNSYNQILKWCYDCLDEFYEEYLEAKA